jgi:glycopeptide antibiotics resistance protein
MMEKELTVVEEKRPSKWRATLPFALAGVFVILIMAASWAPESQMTKLSWIPGWIANLADREPNIRTAIPFIPLAFLLFRGLSARRVKRPLIGALMTCTLLLFLAELGQNFLPHRTADVKDLMWGGVGIGLGIGLARCLRRTKLKFEIGNRK